MINLIPAYEPDWQLPALIRSIRDAEPWATLVVVDDGSGPGFKDVFDGVKARGCHVIGYARNRGKGFALKTGFGFIADHLPGQNVICADGLKPAATPGAGGASPFALSGDSRLPGVESGLVTHLDQVRI